MYISRPSAEYATQASGCPVCEQGRRELGLRKVAVQNAALMRERLKRLESSLPPWPKALRELVVEWDKRRVDAAKQGAARESGAEFGNPSFCYGYAEAVVDCISGLKKALEEEES